MHFYVIHSLSYTSTKPRYTRINKVKLADYCLLLYNCWFEYISPTIYVYASLTCIDIVCILKAIPNQNLTRSRMYKHEKFSLKYVWKLTYDTILRFSTPSWHQFDPKLLIGKKTFLDIKLSKSNAPMTYDNRLSIDGKCNSFFLRKIYLTVANSYSSFNYVLCLGLKFD